jgi:hypothetical protein
VPAQVPATQDELIPSAPAQGSVSPPQTSAAPRASASTRRPTASRRTPVLAINYDYLRRDIRSLTMLAPAMVVLLVIAFFVFR